MSTIKRIIIIALIIFFILVIIYSIAGVVWTYFYDPSQFGNTLNDAGSSFIAIGGESVWILILTFGWIVGWFIYSIFKRRKKLPQDVVQLHIFTALTFFLALDVIAESLSTRNVDGTNLPFLALIIQSVIYIAIGIVLIMRKRIAAYLYAALFLIQVVFYSTLVKPALVSQASIVFLLIGTVAWFILLRRNWGQLH